MYIYLSGYVFPPVWTAAIYWKVLEVLVISITRENSSNPEQQSYCIPKCILWGWASASDNAGDFLHNAEEDGTATSTQSSCWKTRRPPPPVGLPGLEFAFLYPLPDRDIRLTGCSSLCTRQKVPTAPFYLLVELARGRGLQHQESTHNRVSGHAGLCSEERNWGGYASELEV